MVDNWKEKVSTACSAGTILKAIEQISSFPEKWNGDQQGLLEKLVKAFYCQRRNLLQARTGSG